jgi:hypothetical protein
VHQLTGLGIEVLAIYPASRQISLQSPVKQPGKEMILPGADRAVQYDSASLLSERSELGFQFADFLDYLFLLAVVDLEFGQVAYGSGRVPRAKIG